MEKVPQKRKFKPIDSIPNEELNKLDRKDLIERIRQLEAHNTQLRNIISKSQYVNDGSGKERTKPYDFSKCHHRRVLLRIMYLGWDYAGLAVQEDTPQTVERHLFAALIRSCLIESRETSGYHRAGRTDKGVSAFGQVISISLRSKFPTEEQAMASSIANEIPYCAILNRILPKEIRALSWMAIPSEKVDYSARFDCKMRQYKYYFPQSNLNLTAMREGCKYLVGSHDFRNLCKMDVGNGVTEFIRRVNGADIVAMDSSVNETSMHYLMIEGNAFLWHQIRCIFGVLLLIGQGLEKPDIIKELLDVDKHSRKPQYSMALDVPLNLFKCSYELEGDNEWFVDLAELKLIISHLQGLWTSYSVKATMIQDCIRSLEDIYNIKTASEKETLDTACNKEEEDRVICYTDCLLQGVKARVYKPLLERVTCSSLEERIEHYKKRRRVKTDSEQIENKEEFKE